MTLQKKIKLFYETLHITSFLVLIFKFRQQIIINRNSNVGTLSLMQMKDEYSINCPEIQLFLIISVFCFKLTSHQVSNDINSQNTYLEK